MPVAKVLSILAQQGLLTETQVRDLASTPEEARLESMLSDGEITPEMLLDLLSAHYRVPGLLLQNAVLEAEVLGLLSQEVATNLQVLPLRLEGDVLVLVMADPEDVVADDLVRFMTGRSTRRMVALPHDLRQTLQRAYKEDPALRLPSEAGHSAMQALEFHTEPGEDALEADAEDTIAASNSTPVIRAVNDIIMTAVRMRASDIHLEPQEDAFRVRYRIDGVLREVFRLPKRVQATLLSRCKIIAGMDISEKRRPQDGRINVRATDINVDLRVSTLPTFNGEKMVMRVLERSRARIDVSSIGMGERDGRVYADLIRMPQGMIIITGPTGSGKTSTLYGTINRIHSIDVNIVTVEDPVEYTLPGINQVQVNEKAGVTFAVALRSILRQDPNIIMVGEIRDQETAEIAFQSAMTGHLVLSTLHTNDAPSAISRLVYMGLPRYLVAGAVEGILAQRLVRRLCPQCRQPAEPAADTLRLLEGSRVRNMPHHFFNPTGCRDCDNTGYKGRLGIFELLRVTDAIRALVYSETSEQQIRQVSCQQGMNTLLEDGLAKVESGDTSLEELFRVAPVGAEEPG